MYSHAILKISIRCGTSGFTSQWRGDNFVSARNMSLCWGHRADYRQEAALEVWSCSDTATFPLQILSCKVEEVLSFLKKILNKNLLYYWFCLLLSENRNIKYKVYQKQDLTSLPSVPFFFMIMAAVLPSLLRSFIQLRR